MRCLVTGSSGFIGSHLVEALLQRGYIVEGIDVVPSRFPGTRTHIVDVANVDKIKRLAVGADFIFHLAGMLGTEELQDNAYRAAMINIGGTINVLEACRHSGARMILASKPNVWLNTYTITKIASERFLYMYRKEYGVSAAILKWFNVYGPHQQLFCDVGYKNFVPHAIVNAIRKQPIEIYGNGKQLIDLIHTSDTVNAMLAIVDNWDKCDGECYEAGHHVVYVNDVVDMLSDIVGRKLDITHMPMRSGEPELSKVEADTDCLHRDTGWEPVTSLRSGLQRTLEWYRDHYDESD